MESDNYVALGQRISRRDLLILLQDVYAFLERESPNGDDAGKAFEVLALQNRIERLLMP
jgi:hypothetical protein